MKRLHATVLILVATVCLATSALAGIVGPAVLKTRGPIVWRRSVATATNGGAVDSTVFSADGSANATRDTTAWLDMSDMAPVSNGFASAGDSTLWARLTVFPVTSFGSSSWSPGADSLYAYVEGTDDIANGPTVRLATNLTEILTIEANSNNTFEFKISQARAALQLAGLRFIRFIVRGDLNGGWGGRLSYYRNVNPGGE